MMTGHERPTAGLIDEASAEVGVLWPLDRAIAANPLVDRIDERFSDAVATLGARLGIDPWPSALHLEEGARRALRSSTDVASLGLPQPRPATMFERAHGTDAHEVDAARCFVGQVLLEAVTTEVAPGAPVLERASRVLASGSSWVQGPRDIRMAIADMVREGDLDDLLLFLDGWTDAEVQEEMARHFARLPGWAAWAKWNDCWSRAPHPAAVTRRELLTLSLAVDLAWLRHRGSAIPSAPEIVMAPLAGDGLGRLELLEAMVHDEMLDRLHPRQAVDIVEPRFQVVACIDVRSEPLRRALEADPTLETFGFAGFFGVFAEVAPAGDREVYESLPVIAAPTATIVGGPRPTMEDDERVAAGGTLAELTHEPTAMFALAEVTGILGSPWLLARSLVPRARSGQAIEDGPWQLEVDDVVDLAEGALRGMGLTGPFAPEILFLGHHSTSANNPHFASLECGACAGHAGGPNAAALAGVLNDPDVRLALRARGLDIPDRTRFLSGEHDTTREVVDVHGSASDELLLTLKSGSDAVAQWRAGEGARSVASARRKLNRRARDWAEVRPEWGLANHATFVVAPRASLRGVDLAGRSFLHSYDPTADDDGAILGSILSAPMVVAQWINAAYYFSAVAPTVLGAGDKTLLNPVGDFAVMVGEDSDLRLGLPWQSIAAGDRPVHLPVRLLVAVEAPLDRIADVIRSSPMPQQLIDGEWVRLVGRGGSLEPWQRWLPGRGWAEL